MRSIEEISEVAGRNEPVTREEAHALVRHVRRTCRGKAVLDPAIMRSLHLAWDDVSGHADWEKAKKLCALAETESGTTGPEVADGDWEAMGRRVLSAIYAHGDSIGKPCGYDFNDIICAHEFDGKMHTVECPKCGATNVFTAPVFALSE